MSFGFPSSNRGIVTRHLIKLGMNELLNKLIDHHTLGTDDNKTDWEKEYLGLLQDLTRNAEGCGMCDCPHHPGGLNEVSK